MKWLINQPPDRAGYFWWLSGIMPMIVSVNQDGRLGIFGARGKGQHLHQVAGLWAGPIMPDMDMGFHPPETTGYYWTDLVAGAPPIIVSVYIGKLESPLVAVLGMPEPVPLGETTGRWSERLVPPTEVDTSGQLIKPITT